MSQNLEPITSKKKWEISMFAGLMFLVIASPYMASFINNIIGETKFPVALIIQTIIFFLLTRLVMK